MVSGQGTEKLQPGRRALPVLILAACSAAGAACLDAPGPHVDWHDCDKSRAVLIGVDFSGANLSGANLSRAELRNANFSYANLSRANLTAADLTGAELRGARLVEADLSRAVLNTAILSMTNFNNANLSSAIWTDGSICQFGSLGKCVSLIPEGGLSNDRPAFPGTTGPGF
jgi:uncharacterized protein YjbI with pentapeptide repeats